jgi:transposase
MTIIVTTLAATALVFLIFFLVGALAGPERQPQPPEDDLAAPYREGLHAAVRLQRSAQDLEQQIWAEAARHLPYEAEATAIEED